uniref:Uncharacterized protein n=1 Tax=Paracoccus marcusii TaxID=59779 RepID=I6UJE6_9RHOB|nr:hypothetical protein [Paracoccus marcusii]
MRVPAWSRLRSRRQKTHNPRAIPRTPEEVTENRYGRDGDRGLSAGRRSAVAPGPPATGRRGRRIGRRRGRSVGQFLGQGAPAVAVRLGCTHQGGAFLQSDFHLGNVQASRIQFIDKGGIVRPGTAHTIVSVRFDPICGTVPVRNGPVHGPAI